METPTDVAATQSEQGAADAEVDSGIERPLLRPLKVYAFDPSAGKLLGNEMSMQVRYQDLDPGPVIRRRVHDAIAVVDYDGANGTYYKPVDLDHPRILIRGGLDPIESDPRFHQQMVYAVVTETIQHFESALGRRIHWRRGLRDGNPNAALEDIWTLNLYPHAFIGQNAFYSPQARGILFGYFRANQGDVGDNIPGQTIFTCLSHDIVVHETTHAVIDGIRAFFTERTNPDVAAFHEGFADLVALFRHFTHKEALRDTIERTGGALYKYQLRPDARTTPEDQYYPRANLAAGEQDPLLTVQLSQRNPLVELARQFGEATGRQRALRSALGTKPSSDDINRYAEPHLRGSILVAAVFDAYFAIYLKRTADLWRIFRAGGGSDDPTDVPPSLADRLVSEASALSEQFFQLCARALDYCPPVDITFGSFLRALITADIDLRPTDEIGLRNAVMQAFRLRGIVPNGAGSLSEGAVAWPTAKSLLLDPVNGLNPVNGLDFGDSNGLSKSQKQSVRTVLQAYVDNPKNREKLGFDASLPVLIPSFHSVFRMQSDGSLRTDMVVEMVQTRDERLVNRGDFGTFPFRGGATVIIRKPTVYEEEMTNRDTNICFVIARHLNEAGRAERQRRYGEYLGLDGARGSNHFQVNFAMVHGGSWQ